MITVSFKNFGGPEVLTISAQPIPVPGPDQVLVHLRAAAVLPVDCKVRSGALRTFFEIAFPKIPGRDGAGVVAAVGSGVSYAKPGDRVCVVAGHTEQGTYRQAMLAGRDTLIPMPSGMTFADAAALVHAGVCSVICLCDTARIAPGMRVLIHGGSGAIGSLAIQLAKSMGAYVATTCRAANRDHALAMGADIAIAYDQDDFTRLAEPFDVVLDLVGGEVHKRSYEVLRAGGHLVCLNAASIRDLSEQFGVKMTVARVYESPDILRRVMALASAGVLRPQRVMTLPLEQAAEAHRLMEAGKATGGRIVLDIPPLRI